MSCGEKALGSVFSGYCSHRRCNGVNTPYNRRKCIVKCHSETVFQVDPVPRDQVIDLSESHLRICADQGTILVILFQSGQGKTLVIVIFGQ